MKLNYNEIFNLDIKNVNIQSPQWSNDLTISNGSINYLNNEIRKLNNIVEHLIKKDKYDG